MQTVQTLLHPGSKNSGGPVSLADLPSTSQSVVNLCVDHQALHLQHNPELEEGKNKQLTTEKSRTVL